MPSAMLQPSCSHRNHRSSRQAFSAPLHVRPQRGAPQVCHAIDRAKKESIVADLQERLRGSSMVYGWKYENVAVKDMEKMRRDMPEGASMRVAKNRLLRVAIDGMADDEKARWKGLIGYKGMNAYVFVTEDAIRGAVKAYGTLYKELRERQGDPKKAASLPEPTEVRCIVLDGDALDPKTDWKKLETLPTKQDLMLKMAYALKANPLKMAYALKNLPLKVAYAVKALADLSEDKSITIEEAMKLRDAAEAAPAAAADDAAPAEGASPPAAEEGSS